MIYSTIAFAILTYSFTPLSSWNCNIDAGETATTKCCAGDYCVEYKTNRENPSSIKLKGNEKWTELDISWGEI